jgi:hypothetical protein
MEKNKNVRNFVVREMNNKYKSKRFSNDRTNRRAKDARNSWKNETY